MIESKNWFTSLVQDSEAKKMSVQQCSQLQPEKIHNISCQEIGRKQFMTILCLAFQPVEKLPITLKMKLQQRSFEQLHQCIYHKVLHKNVCTVFLLPFPQILYLSNCSSSYQQLTNLPLSQSWLQQKLIESTEKMHMQLDILSCI